MMNNNDLILERLRGIPMQKGTWRDKFDPSNPNVPQANDNQKPVQSTAEVAATECDHLNTEGAEK